MNLPREPPKMKPKMKPQHLLMSMSILTEDETTNSNESNEPFPHSKNSVMDAHEPHKLEDGKFDSSFLDAIIRTHYHADRLAQHPDRSAQRTDNFDYGFDYEMTEMAIKEIKVSGVWRLAWRQSMSPIGRLNEHGRDIYDT